MLKKLQKKQISIIAAAALFAFLTGAMVSAPEIGKSLGQWLKLSQNKAEEISDASIAQSTVLPLISQSLPERAAKLAEIAGQSPSPDRNRARYLLASDYIERTQAQKSPSFTPRVRERLSYSCTLYFAKTGAGRGYAGRRW